MAMRIETIPIEKLNPAPYNPRLDLKPGDREYDKIKRSIVEFDLVEPLVWNEATGYLVGGHQRLKVLKDLGIQDVQVSIVNIPDQNREKALNIPLNKIQGDWDWVKLKDVMQELNLADFDVTLTGFDGFDLDDLIGPKSGLTGDDAVPEAPKTAKTKINDLYILGEHRLMCGDAININHLNLLMDNKKSDLVFTDPPYNVDYEGYTEENLTIKNDKMSDQDFKKFLLDVFSSYRMILKDGGSLYICHPSLYQREFQDSLEQSGFSVRTQIIWAKNTFAWGYGRYKFQHEPIFYAYIKGQTDPWYGDKTQSTLWQENKPAANKLHPTMKPVELISRGLQNSSKAGDIVIDLFGGSGSTMIASEKLGRRCFMMEIDPIYCDVIVKRWEEFTGKEAHLVRNGT